MKALVGAFNQEKALVGAFSVIVQPVVEPMEYYTALASPGHPLEQEQESSGHGGGLHSAGGLQARPLYRGAGAGHSWRGHFVDSICGIFSIQVENNAVECQSTVVSAGSGAKC